MKQILTDKAFEIEADVLSREEVDMKKQIDSKREFLPDFNLDAQKPSKIYDVTSSIQIIIISELKIFITLYNNINFSYIH